MRKIITISNKERRRICRVYQISESYLSEILHFKKDSLMAREIRQYCIGTLHASVLEENPP